MRVGLPDDESETVDAVFIRLSVHADDFSTLRNDLLLPITFISLVDSVNIAGSIDEAQSIDLKLA